VVQRQLGKGDKNKIRGIYIFGILRCFLQHLKDSALIRLRNSAQTRRFYIPGSDHAPA
jgi:hypothetical protein